MLGCSEDAATTMECFFIVGEASSLCPLVVAASSLQLLRLHFLFGDGTARAPYLLNQKGGSEWKVMR